MNIFLVESVLPNGIEEIVNPYPPSPFQSLLFYCNDPVYMGLSEDGPFNLQPLMLVVGPQYSRVNIKVKKQIRAIRVDFLPGALHRLLGIPMHELFDKAYEASELFGPAIKTLNEQLQNEPDLEVGKNYVEAFLITQIPRSKQILPVDAALRELLVQQGNISTADVAALSCLSLKQFERKCRERIGMNPKMYARILKFSKAYRLHESSPHLSWTNIAHEAGYFDQMHMIRDFKTFAGVNPSVIEQQLLSTPLRMQKHMRI